MATFIALGSFTDQGIRNVKESPARLEAFKQMAERHGLSIRGAWYTTGSHDFVIVTEGSEEAAMTTLLQAGSLGNVRTQTLRAFSPDEVKRFLSKIS